MTEITSADYVLTPSLKLRALLAAARTYFNPKFIGLEHLDLSKPALFVGNHTVYGLTDVPLMIDHLFREYGVVLRSLGDRAHFKIPGWRSMLQSYGMVLGSPENCSLLMQAQVPILVFPGGGREVCRRKGEKYRLIWKQRMGFVRLAIQHGYDIIPFGVVGPDDSFDILVDANDIMRTPLWRACSQFLAIDRFTRNGDLLPPIARGIGLSIAPKPQRYYFRFGQRISTRTLQGMQSDTNAVTTVRELVSASIELQLAELLRFRQKDCRRHWGVLRQCLTTL